MCYEWDPIIIWLHVISDGLITVAYYSIPITLFYFVHKRRDLQFGWIFLCFAVFIIACGTTHFMEIWNIWHPLYWLSGAHQSRHRSLLNHYGDPARAFDPSGTLFTESECDAEGWRLLARQRGTLPSLR